MIEASIMKYSTAMALLCCASLQGCTTFEFDYQPPKGENIAKVVIKSSWNGSNQRVIYHGANACNPNEAKLVGLINAGAAGQKNVQQIEITVPAGVEAKISLPQIDLQALRADSATFRYCQPILSFVPMKGQNYILEFGSCRAELFSGDPMNAGAIKPVPGKLDQTCRVTAENKGTDAKLFYLSEKAPQ